ncbi:hypothetical protein ACFL0H_13805 [Thermodesulfobacteriota bacterium]
MNEKENDYLLLSDQTGALMLLDKKERKLLKQLLFMTMGSENGRTIITKKLGPEYIKIADKLLKALGDS